MREGERGRDFKLEGVDGMAEWLETIDRESFQFGLFRPYKIWGSCAGKKKKGTFYFEI